MDKKVFAKEINKLVIEYSDKSFTMPKERVEQWYESLNQYSEENLKYAVKQVLETMSFAPTLADLIKHFPSQSIYRRDD